MKIAMKVVRTITPESFAEQMREISETEYIYNEKMCMSFGIDEETRHIMADDLICEVLESLGYADGVNVFREMPKWYS